MKIIIGHSNMDLDCIGSMVLAGYLFPDHNHIKSRFIHPVAKNLYNLYRGHLNFLSVKEMKSNNIERIVIVDTRSRKRLIEYFEHIKDFDGEIEIFDHHPFDSSDFYGAVIHERDVGSNTTIIGLELIKKEISISSDDATIALTGIYADTGNFTHDDVKEEDFHVASYLLRNGASLKLVRTFLKSLNEDHQITLFHEILNKLIYKDFHGHFIILCYIEMEKQAGGLAAVVEKVFEVENPDAIFAVFTFKKEKDTLIIGRSQKKNIEVNKILENFDGGGHRQASSALVKNASGMHIFEKLEKHLLSTLVPAVIAEQIMSEKVEVINEEWSLKEASIFLEDINHTGCPVVDKSGKLTGFLTLRNIMKGRKAGQMHAPVKAYMTRKVITGKRNTTIRKIENLLFKNNVGHIPIVENKKVVGIVSRTDYLNFVDRREIVK